MYVSMTGFSRSQVQTAWGTLSMEISSVNHRYQEISVRLPREFASWEPWFHQKLRKLFRRGKVQMRLEVLWARRRAGRRRADDYPAVQGRGYVYPFIIYLLCHLRQLRRQNFF